MADPAAAAAEYGELFASFETRDTITSIAFVGDALLAGTFDKRLHGFSLRISAASEQGGAGERSLFNQELFSESFPGQVTAISCATDSRSLSTHAHNPPVRAAPVAACTFLPSSPARVPSGTPEWLLARQSDQFPRAAS